MSDPDYEAHYKPPDAVLDGHSRGNPSLPAGPVRVLLAAVTGFLVDVIGTQVLGIVLAVLRTVVAPTTPPPFMDFANWAGSLTNPWTVAAFALGTLMSVLAGWLGATIARQRAWPMYYVLLVLYLGYSIFGYSTFSYSAGQELSSVELGIDWLTFIQVLFLNLAAPGVGVLLRVRFVKRRRMSMSAVGLP